MNLLTVGAGFRLGSIALALVLAGCSGLKDKPDSEEKCTALFECHPEDSKFINEDAVLPIEEIERVLVEYRQKAEDDPSVINLANFNRIITVRHRNLLRIQEERRNLEVVTYGVKYEQVNKDYTVDWFTEERGGAAMRQAGYEHTLAGNNSFTPATPTSVEFKSQQSGIGISAFPTMLNDAVRVGIKTAEIGQPSADIPLSIYELARWERFCLDGGKNLTKADKDYVNQQGLNNMPLHLRNTCNPPQ